MKIKTGLIAAVLTVLPAIAVAECSWGHQKEQVTMSCAAGTVFDEASGTCVTSVSS